MLHYCAGLQSCLDAEDEEQHVPPPSSSTSSSLTSAESHIGARIGVARSIHSDNDEDDDDDLRQRSSTICRDHVHSNQ
jgi:hypothetical protein